MTDYPATHPMAMLMEFWKQRELRGESAAPVFAFIAVDGGPDSPGAVLGWNYATRLAAGKAAARLTASGHPCRVVKVSP